MLGVQSAYRRGRDSVVVQAPVAHQRAQDQRHRRRGILAADGQQQFACLIRQRTGASAVTAWPRHERLQAAFSVGVIPALQRGHRDGLREVSSGQTESLLGQSQKFGAQIAVRKLSPAKRSHDLATKNGYRLAVVLGSECIHGHSSLCRSIRRPTTDACTGFSAGGIMNGGLMVPSASPSLLPRREDSPLTWPARRRQMRARSAMRPPAAVLGYRCSLPHARRPGAG